MIEGIYFTQNLSRTWMEAPAEVKGYIEEAVLHYINEFEQGRKHHNDASLAYTVMGMVDQAMKERVDWNMVRCKKGCAFCCHINIDMTLAEAEVIVQYCKDNDIAINEKLLEIQKSLTIQQRNAHKDNRCAFLSPDNTCSIYEVRPLACRKYIVASKPKHCDASKGTREVAVISELRTEILISAYSTLKMMFGNMSQMTLKALKDAG